MKRIFSPYRICPLGAHVDHQGGAVLGRTMHLGTIVEYEPLHSKIVHITSDQFGEATFCIGELDRDHWARYAQAAARVLPALQRGMRTHVRGSLIGAGLSSSAAVGLAYLRALADVNEIELTNDQLVRLDYELEHGQLGLQNGILDPLTIVHGVSDALLLMDTVTATVRPIPDAASREAVWMVAYSGVSRELTKSGFNVRVEECRQAAALLKKGAHRFCDVPRDLFEEKKTTLPGHLRKRAQHFFSEVERVHQGAQAWEEADLTLFGQLMNQSCESSIKNSSALLGESTAVASAVVDMAAVWLPWQTGSWHQTHVQKFQRAFWQNILSCLQRFSSLKREAAFPFSRQRRSRR